jgi:hypothetical protein
LVKLNSKAGRGLFNDGGTMLLTNSTISGNRTDSFGGAGIYNASGSVTLSNLSITNNSIAVSSTLPAAWPFAR